MFFFTPIIEKVTFFVEWLYHGNKFFYLVQLHIRTQHILHIYTHMPYSILTPQISLQLTHTHFFIVSAYLDSIVWYIRFMYGDLVEASHQSYRFTAKSWHLFTYHAARTFISATCVIIYMPVGRSAFFFFLNAFQRSWLACWLSLQLSSCPLALA